ncbi:MAG: hypothetical protein EP330_21435 [Deltaproteobacteria bacterium]|nr:MAG: hypothetical protein EP330_21435 [Deltaproteobacteria bacterium]
MRRLLPLVLLCACSSSSDTRWGVLSFIELGRQTDGVTHGFDLDGITSEEDGDSGCGIGDYTSPDGVEGIDNAMARIMPVLDATEASALEPLINQNINLGEVLMIFGVNGIDDPLDDEEVEVTFVRGYGAPIVGADGRIVSGQTFERDESLEPVTVEGSLENGVLEASGLDVTFPIEIFDANPVLDVQNVTVHFEYDDKGDFVGYLGGALNYDRIIEGVEDAAVDAALLDTLPLLFENNADLPSEEDGECSRLSVTIEFDGLNAHLFEPPEGFE